MRGGTALMVAAAGLILPDYAAATSYPDTVFIGPVEQSLPFTGGSGQPPFDFAHDWITNTHVQIRETEEPGADAEVYYQNAMVNDSATDDGREYFAQFGDLVIEVIFDHNYKGGGPDLVTILPPDGYICKPSCEMLVDEQQHETIYLIPWVMGDENDGKLVPLQNGYRLGRLVLPPCGRDGCGIPRADPFPW